MLAFYSACANGCEFVSDGNISVFHEVTFRKSPLTFLTEAAGCKSLQSRGLVLLGSVRAG